MEHRLTLRVSVRHFKLTVREIFSFLSDKYNMCNLAHHYKDFHIEASWTFMEKVRAMESVR